MPEPSPRQGTPEGPQPEDYAPGSKSDKAAQSQGDVMLPCMSSVTLGKPFNCSKSHLQSGAE